MKLTSALTTLVTLTTFASAAPQKYNLLNARQFSNDTGGAGIGANGLNGTSSLPIAPTTPGGGAGVAPQNTNTGLTTTTTTQTVVSTVTQQYTTFPQTNLFTATLTLPGGGAGVAPGSTNAPGTPGTTTNPDGTVVVVAAPGTGSNSGSGTGATSNTGSGSGTGSGSTGSGSTGSGSTGSGSTGSGSGTGSGAGSCVCPAAQTVIATGIHTVTVADVISLGDVVYTTTYPSTTLGAMTIVGGNVIAAVPTVTKTAVIATNTNAALPAGQAYSTVTIPAQGSQPATTVVIIISVITNNVAPVTVTPDNGGAGAGAQPASRTTTTTAGPFTNVTMTLSASNNPTGVASASVSLPLSSSAAGGANVGAAVTATTGQTQAPTNAAAVTPTTTTAANGQVTAAPVAGTRVSAVGNQGNTPLYNQDAFISAILNYHNQLRARHNAPQMTWNQDLANFALTNANTNAAKRTFLHTKEMGLDNPYGENIATQYGYNNPEYLVYLWYDEIKQYNYGNPVFSESTGHFTQVVWDASTQLGCAYVQADDTNMNYLLTCEYSAPGNYAGEFTTNVNKPVVSGDATAPAQRI